MQPMGDPKILGAIWPNALSLSLSCEVCGGQKPTFGSSTVYTEKSLLNLVDVGDGAKVSSEVSPFSDGIFYCKRGGPTYSAVSGPPHPLLRRRCAPSFRLASWARMHKNPRTHSPNEKRRHFSHFSLSRCGRRS